MAIIKVSNQGFSGTKGITMADAFRKTATSAFSATTNTTITGWERVDTEFSQIGTGLTESSGIFTFPQTGIYFISYSGVFSDTQAVRYVGNHLYVSTDGGSNFSVRSYGYQAIPHDTDTWYMSQHQTHILDVTDISNFQFKWVINPEHNMNIQGNTNNRRTGFEIFRIGDT